MPYGWVAAATVAAGALGAGASKSAGDTQAGAADRATGAQIGMFNMTNTQGAPWRQAGQNALGAILEGQGTPQVDPSDPRYQDILNTLKANQDAAHKEQYGFSLFDPRSGYSTPGGKEQTDQAWAQEAQKQFISKYGAPASAGGVTLGQFNKQFTPADLTANLAPSYGFMLGQGLGATQNALNVGGGNISGNTVRGMTKFAEDYASTGYQQAFENYTANQTNIFNRLADIAGLGQTQNQTTASTAVGLGPSTASSMMSAGASRAAGTVGMANAIGGGATNAASWYAMPQMISAMNRTQSPAAGGDTGNV